MADHGRDGGSFVRIFVCRLTGVSGPTAGSER